MDISCSSRTMHQQQQRLTLEAAASNVPPTSVGGIAYDGKIAGLYDLEETLGSGHFAVVKLARHVFTGAKVAVKVVDKTKLDEVSRAHLFQEVRCMKLVQHPNVVRLYEVIDTQTKLYLILELGDGGDLYDYIMRHEGGLNEELARKYFRQILRAITYCHQLHVVHRDLKPENVVFFEKLGVVKLTDFGFSNKFQPGQKLETSCGSLAYSAPEILLGDSYDAPAVDIWSLGVILYMLVCGQPPFEKANDSETLTMIMDCKYTVPPQISAECRHLIGSMLVRDPKKRASLEEIAIDPWLISETTTYDTSDFLPLVSRQELSEEDHAFIIQKMINGNIAAKEEILQSLDKNQYNHITATYYLLAELRLRKRREDHAQRQQQHPVLLVSSSTASAKNSCANISSQEKTTTTTSDKANNKLNVPVSISVSVASPVAVEINAKSDKRSRKCSIVREEDEEDSSYENASDPNELTVAIRHESISDGRLNRSIQERTKSGPLIGPSSSSCGIPTTVTGTGGSSLVRSKLVPPMDAALAEKLQQIDQHQNDMNDDDALAETIVSMKELDISKLKSIGGTGNKNPVLTHRRTKLNKIRTPSCSSSEASDDDTKARSKKKINKFVGDTPIRFRMHRRDSHDDSSDSQDQAFPSSGSHGHTSNMIGANNTSNVSGKKEGQTQGKEQNKSEETRKSHSNTQQKHKKQSHKEQTTVMEEKLALSGAGGVTSSRKSLLLMAASIGRRRIRESQSLDRITEAQEYEHRHRNSLHVESHLNVEQRNSLFDLNEFSVAETKEEYDDTTNEKEEEEVETEAVDEVDEVVMLTTKIDIINESTTSDQLKNTLNLIDNDAQSQLSLLQIKRNKKKYHHHTLYKLKSIEEIDLILDEKSLSAKAKQVAGSKCLKKIRRLGKYFPVVNFT